MVRLRLYIPIAAIVATCLASFQATGLEEGNRASTQPQETAAVIRVGIVANVTEGNRLQRGLERFAKLEAFAQSIGSRIHFKVAIGAYNDVYYWMKRSLIDMAVVSPGIYATLKQPQSASDEHWIEIAIEVSPEGREECLYHSMCVVRRDSKITKWDQVVDLLGRANDQDTAQILIADPLSLSGYLAPAHVLLDRISHQKIQNASRFLSSHDAPLNELRRQSSSGKPMVAFLSEQEPLDDELVRVRDCPLEQMWLPLSSIVVRETFDRTNLEELFRKWESANDTLRTRGSVPANGTSMDANEAKAINASRWFTVNRNKNKQAIDRRKVVDMSEIGRWSNQLVSHAEVPDMSLDEIAYALSSYANQPPSTKTFKIAMVLSGGGAKCAYQVGAIAAIENRMAQLRAENGSSGPGKDEKFDIQLVVGTSGGALNAVPVAMGITRRELGVPTSLFSGGQLKLKNVWTTLNTWKILSAFRAPTIAAAAVVGAVTLVGLYVFGGVVKFILLLSRIARVVMRSLIRRKKRRHAKPKNSPPLRHYWHLLRWEWRFGPPTCVGSVLVRVPWLTIGAVAITCAYASVWYSKIHLNFNDFSLTRRHSFWNNLPFESRFWAWATGFTLVFNLIFFGVYGYRYIRRHGYGVPFITWPRSTLVLLILVLTVGTFICFALRQKSVISPEGLEDEVTQHYLHLVQWQTNDTRIKTAADVSKYICAEADRDSKHFRDLVLTATNVAPQENEPSDFYLYLPRKSESKPPSDARNWVPLTEAPESLIDVVLGSGAIFPFFPPRHIDRLSSKGRVELIDGGFAHNSPIEAATLWNATHIFQIEASPSESADLEDYVLGNAKLAYHYLYEEAQAADARAKAKSTAVVFLLRPDHLETSLLGFEPWKVDRAIYQGFQDASGRIPAGSPVANLACRARAFRRQPVFPDLNDIRPLTDPVIDKMKAIALHGQANQ